MWHVAAQAWCEAAAGDLPLESDFEADTSAGGAGGGDWLAETSESQRVSGGSLSLRQALPAVGARPGAAQQASPLLDPVEEASSEGTPSSAQTAARRVSWPPVAGMQLSAHCNEHLAWADMHAWGCSPSAADGCPQGELAHSWLEPPLFNPYNPLR
jgi:hypothetical protein